MVSIRLADAVLWPSSYELNLSFYKLTLVRYNTPETSSAAKPWALMRWTFNMNYLNE
jgi:hypothetical protein